MAVNNAAIILLCIFAFSSTLALRKPIKYKECPGGSGSVLKSVDLEPFKQDHRGAYIFKRGTNVTATIVFTSKEMVTEASVHLYVMFAGRKMEMKVPHPNACENHNIECPLKPDVEYTMIGKIEVMRNLPRLPFTVQLDVELPNKKYLYCFQMEVHIM